METYWGYGTRFRGSRRGPLWLAWLVICASVVLVGTGTLPTKVDKATAVGSGCTASTGAVLYQYTYSGTQYCTEEFRSNGTWTKPTWVSSIDVMVVGGGGEGGCCWQSVGGGGGGGGVIAETNYPVPSATYPVVVGCGGGNTGCSANGGSSSFGGTAFVAGGGSYGSSSGTGGSSGSCSKNGVAVCTVRSGASGSFYNGAPQFYMGGGGAGVNQSGFAPQMGQETYNGTVYVNGGYQSWSWTRSYINNHPYGGMGASLVNNYWGFNRDVGCGGGGGLTLSYSTGSGGPGWKFYLDDSSFYQLRGCITNYSSGYGGRNYTQPFISGYSYMDDPSNMFQAGNPSAGATIGTYPPGSATPYSGNGGGGSGGCNAYPSTGNICLESNGASGVVLIRYVAPVPVNTAAPTISPANTPWVGTTLTRTEGTWTTPMGTLVTPYSGKWVRRLNSVDTDIPGATNPTYTVTQADIGYQILYVETADNGLGTASASSTPTVAVQGQPAFTTNSPTPLATLNQAYSYTFAASGGSVTYTLVNSNLPGTITLSSAGVLSGTPTVAGSYTYTVRATNSVGSVDTTHELHAGRTAVLNTLSTPQTSGATFTISPTVTLTTGATPGVGVAVTASIQSSPGGSPVLGGTLTQNTNSSGVATFSGLTLTGLIGTYTIRFSGGPNWPVANLTVTLSAGTAAALAVGTQPVGNVLPGVTLQTVPVVRVVDSGGNVITSSTAPITASIASGSSNATLSVTSANASSGVATFTGMKVNNAGGNFTLTFSSPGLTSVTSSQFTINRTSQTITFNYTGGAKTYTSLNFGVSASTTSQLPITFTSATPLVCGVTGNASAVGGVTGAVISINGVGTCTIHADQPGNDQYSPATRQSINFSVTQAAQSTLTISSTNTSTFGNTLTLVTSGGSGSGAVSYAFVGGAGTASCTLNQSTGAMTFGSAGTCTVKATKAGDTNFTSINSVDHVITVARAAQSTSITSAVPANPLPGGTYQVTATASSGLAPTLAIMSGLGTVCSISGSSSPATITFLTSGSCVVKASQAGNGNYLSAAVEAQQTIVVGSLNQTITFNSLANRQFGDPNSTVSVSASSGLTVSLTNETPAVCALSGRTVSILTVGRCTITANQAGNSVWSAASAVSRSFDIIAVVPNAPSLTSVSAQSAAVMVGFASPGFNGGSPVTAYRLVATPTGGGTAVSSDDCVVTPCLISGLENGTEYTVTVAAINGVGVGPASSASPAITPATAALAVRNATSTPGNGSLYVTWIAPDDLGGGTFTKYELRIREIGEPWPSASSYDVTSSLTASHVFNGLDNGTQYEVQIVTITTANQVAILGNTAVVSAVPLTVPTAPISVTGTETTPRGATISWSEPVSNGGSVITGYVVSIDRGATCGTATIDLSTRTGSCTVTGLALSTTYTITVAAINAAGTGPTASGSYTTRTFTTTPSPPPPVGSPSCSSCVTDPDDPDRPSTASPTPLTTPPSQQPGTVTLTDGIASVSLSSAAGTNSNVDAFGRLVVVAPGSLKLTGSGLLATTSVTMWWSNESWGSGTVASDGTLDETEAIPSNAFSGSVRVFIDAVNENGASRRFVFTVYVLASSPPALPGTGGWTGGPGSTGGAPGGNGDPSTPCESCVSVFPDPGTQPVVSTAPAGTTPARTTITTSSGTTATLGGPGGPGGASTAVDKNGAFVVRPPGTLPVTLGGLLPGSQVTVWIGGVFSVTGTVGSDGTIVLNAPIPASLAPGSHTVRVDAVEANGSAISFLYGFRLLSSSARLPVTGTDVTPLQLTGLWLLVAGVFVARLRRRRLFGRLI